MFDGATRYAYIVCTFFYYLLFLAKEVMFLVALVCLFVCGQNCSKSYERIRMKFYGGALGSIIKN